MNQSSLFNSEPSGRITHVLPKDGRADYHSSIFNELKCAELMGHLQQTLLWEQDQLVMFGRSVTTRRKVAWVGDPKCAYTYSGVKKQPQEWTSELLLIRAKLEEIAQSEFNSCLLNLYHDGSDGMGWHSDDEKELDPKSPIASLSLGAQRKFVFRHKEDKTTVPLFLENGSVLVMHAPMQQFWHHSLLKTTKVSAPRINLTFRKIILRDK
jgi:alkylated DNA repair dioxygenase AlkB